MTKLELLEKLDKEAASAPWGYSTGYGSAFIDNADNQNIASAVEYLKRPDADLICEMRNSLPDLLAVVRAVKNYKDLMDEFALGTENTVEEVALDEALADLENK